MAEKKIKYKVFSLRLNDKTITELKRKKLLSGKSWNLFIFNLLGNEIQKRK